MYISQLSYYSIGWENQPIIIMHYFFTLYDMCRCDKQQDKVKKVYTQKKSLVILKIPYYSLWLSVSLHFIVYKCDLSFFVQPFISQN